MKSLSYKDAARTSRISAKPCAAPSSCDHGDPCGFPTFRRTGTDGPAPANRCRRPPVRSHLDDRPMITHRSSWRMQGSGRHAAARAGRRCTALGRAPGSRRFPRWRGPSPARRTWASPPGTPSTTPVEPHAGAQAARARCPRRRHAATGSMTARPRLGESSLSGCGLHDHRVCCCRAGSILLCRPPILFGSV